MSKNHRLKGRLEYVEPFNGCVKYLCIDLNLSKEAAAKLLRDLRFHMDRKDHFQAYAVCFMIACAGSGIYSTCPPPSTTDAYACELVDTTLLALSSLRADKDIGPKAWYLSMFILFGLTNMVGASEAAFLETVARAPTSVLYTYPVQELLVCSAIRHHRFREAYVLSLGCINLLVDNNDATARLMCATALQKMGPEYVETSLKFFEAAYLSQPESVEIQSHYGSALLSTDPAKAQRILQSCHDTLTAPGANLSAYADLIAHVKAHLATSTVMLSSNTSNIDQARNAKEKAVGLLEDALKICKQSTNPFQYHVSLANILLSWPMPHDIKKEAAAFNRAEQLCREVVDGSVGPKSSQTTFLPKRRVRNEADRLILLIKDVRGRTKSSSKGTLRYKGEVLSVSGNNVQCNTTFRFRCSTPNCPDLGYLHCTACKGNPDSQVAYCSEWCQRKDWHSHKTVCKSRSAKRSIETSSETT